MLENMLLTPCCFLAHNKAMCFQKHYDHGTAKVVADLIVPPTSQLQ